MRTYVFAAVLTRTVKEQDIPETGEVTVQAESYEEAYALAMSGLNVLEVGKLILTQEEIV